MLCELLTQLYNKYVILSRLFQKDQAFPWLLGFGNLSADMINKYSEMITKMACTKKNVQLHRLLWKNKECKFQIATFIPKKEREIVVYFSNNVFQIGFLFFALRLESKNLMFTFQKLTCKCRRKKTAVPETSPQKVGKRLHLLKTKPVTVTSGDVHLGKV